MTNILARHGCALTGSRLLILQMSPAMTRGNFFEARTVYTSGIRSHPRRRRDRTYPEMLTEEGAMKPRAEALPRPGAEVKPGKFGSPIPKTVANGFTIIAKVRPGCAPTIRAYANAIEKAVIENREV